MKNTLITLVLSLIGVCSALCQREYTVSAGLGYSLIGSGDDHAVTMENEINASISRYFSSSFSLNFGRGIPSKYLIASSFTQANLNVLGVAFPDSKVRLYMGVGASLFNLSESSVSVGHTDVDTGQWVVDLYNTLDYTTVGMNLILEPNYKLTEQLTLGIKLIAQLYKNGDTNAGGILKLGYSFIK